MNIEEINAQAITEWLVVRINYAEPLEHFLVTSFKPFVNTLVAGGIVDRYFWQRGEERGTHILLTMRGDTRKLNELILPNFAEHFHRYAEDIPSYRYVDKADFEPNNSIQTQTYSPNAEGAVGLIGLPIFERYQQASSEAVLAFMADHFKDWSPTEAATTAMKLHLGYCDASGMEAADVVAFFEHCLARHSEEAFSVQLFEYIYRRWAHELDDFVAQIWKSLKKGGLFREKHYNRWLENCYYTTEDIRLTYRKSNRQTEPDFDSLWDTIAKFQKTTNRQLNLHGRQASITYYLAMRAMENLK
jgi:Lantibiotic biosynthesis dehydratase C-term